MSWNPEQYLKFSTARMRPAIDLLARIDAQAPKIVCDLGCGAGNVTQLLAKRWPDAQVFGVDDSHEMLNQADKLGGRIRWQHVGIGDWTPHTPCDVLFTNASLHWLPDHERLFPRLFDCVASGGTLAIQMPRNFHAPSHTSIEDTARQGRWNEVLSSLLKPPPVADPEFYYRILRERAIDLDIWETEYLHELIGDDPVKEWVKGTWLKQFLDALPLDQRSEFEFDYARRLRNAYPKQANGKTVFPFRRLFIVARRI